MPDKYRDVEQVTHSVNLYTEFLDASEVPVHLSTKLRDDLSFPLDESFIVCAKATGQPLARYKNENGNMVFLFVDPEAKCYVTCQECLEWMHS